MIDWLYVHFVYGTLLSAFISLILILCLYDLISCGCRCLFRPSCIFFYIFYIFKIIFFITFFIFFRSYSFLCAVVWWPVQWAFVAFLVTWNKYDDDDHHHHQALSNFDDIQLITNSIFSELQWIQACLFGIMCHLCYKKPTALAWLEHPL